MKKIVCLFLAALLLAGCQARNPETTAPAQTTLPQEATVAPALTEDTTPIQTVPDMAIGQQTGEEIRFTNPGKVRLEYTGNRGYVKYITSVDQLPDEEVLKGYDEAFFEHSALLIVVETVNSGSVQLEIGGIFLNGEEATVTLKRTMPGEIGTADMATWLLWAEVEKDLTYNWNLEGKANQTEGSKY